MRTQVECMTCLVKQAAGLAREYLAPHVREPFMRRVLKGMARFDCDSPPPLFTREIYRIIRDLDGKGDPYEERKRHFNGQVLSLEPRLRRIIASRPDTLETALRMAVAGNIIDFGVGAHGDAEIAVEDTIMSALDSPFAVNDIPELLARLGKAERILYVADNAGEIVLDRIFIEHIGPGKVTCAVRSAPVINDATLSDASQAGLDRLCRVIPSGSEAPGTPLSSCSEEFMECFEAADLVVSKGQGNYETLDAPGREVFHLFMVKCPIVSEEVGAPMGSFMAMKRG